MFLPQDQARSYDLAPASVVTHFPRQPEGYEDIDPRRQASPSGQGLHQYQYWLAAASTVPTDKESSLIVRISTVAGITVKVMLDKGSVGCVVRESLVNHNQHTWNLVNVRMIDGSAVTCPIVSLTVELPFFSGRAYDAAIKRTTAWPHNGITRSRSYTKDAVTQTEQQSYAAITRA